MYAKMQKFLILGVSKSGCAVTEYLLSQGAVCYICEELKSQKIESTISKLIGLGAISVTKEQASVVIESIDVLVISPGVPINHELAVSAKQAGKRIMGELEFAFLQFIPPIIAVTGTNGKTTTVTLLESIFNQAETAHKIVGNLGVPVTKEIQSINRETICVTEVSSFQLESVNSFCPHVSCVLNIAPDHLERHYTMENYIFL